MKKTQKLTDFAGKSLYHFDFIEINSRKRNRITDTHTKIIFQLFQFLIILPTNHHTLGTATNYHQILLHHISYYDTVLTVK